MLYLIGIIAALSGALYLTLKSAKRYKADYITQLGRANHNATLYNQSQEARRALENDLSRLRTGSPDDRLDASLDLLRQSAERTGAKPAPGLADLAAAARRDKP